MAAPGAAKKLGPRAGQKQAGRTSDFCLQKVKLENRISCIYFVCMKKLGVEWNSNKAAENLKKHGVTFEEAQTVFFDDLAVEFYDDKHSEWEDRFLLLGLSAKMRLLMVCHSYRENESIIRIISARKATKNEAKYYNR